MATRRGSTNFVPKANPYQIYHTNVEAGKNVAGTKRKLCWRFGWTDSEQEHSVDLKHSLVSGKRTIYEDGREINSSQGMFSSEFSHGWESNKHIFRIEANTSISSDPVYTFTIDGVRFEDFIRKPDKLDIPSRQEDDVPQQSSKPFPSSSSASTSSNTSSKPKQSAFPSVDDGNASFDPFADSSSKKNTQSGQSGNFDPFSSSSSSDPFASSSQSKPKSQDHDFFGPSSTPAAAPASSNANVDFFAAPAPAPEKKVATDFFSTPVPQATANTNSDPFSSKQPTMASGSNAFDFAGLTYTPTPMQPAPKPFVSQPPPPPVEQQTQPPAPNGNGDVWGGLVDLNLGAKKEAPQRRSSIQGTGPTLNQMTTTQSNVNVMQSNSNTPFGVTHMSGVSGFQGAPSTGAYAPPPSKPVGQYDPFGASSTPMSGFGAPAAYPAYPPQQVNSSSAISGMGNPFGPPAGNHPPPFGGVNVYGGGYQQPNQAKPQQNSLDSLNWKM